MYRAVSYLDSAQKIYEKDQFLLAIGANIWPEVCLLELETI